MIRTFKALSLEKERALKIPKEISPPTDEIGWEIKVFEERVIAKQ